MDDDALFELAKKYDEADEYGESLPLYIELAEKGYAKAQNRLGRIYEFGEAKVEKDLEKAFDWFMKSAMQGNTDAMVNLGDLYKELGFPEDNPEKGVEWYFKAKELGSVRVLSRIGILYLEGDYYEKDLQKAYECYCEAMKSADDKHEKAFVAFLLGDVLARTEQFEKAFEYLSQAAELGFHEAYVKIGQLYANGLGVEKDEKKAFDYYSLAYNKGKVIAVFKLGEAYRYGYGTEVNYEKAMQLYEEAAEQGHTFAMISLGEMYHAGEGCEKDDEKAIALFKQAAENGDKEAALMMEVLQPFLVDESQLIDKLTDKLIQVAQKPNMRKEFSVTYDTGNGRFFTVVFHKNKPPMFAIEQFFLTAYYVEEFERMAKLENIPDITIPIIIDKTAPWIKPVADKELRLRLHRSLMEIYSKIGSEKGVEHHRAEYEKWEQKESKLYRVKDGTFDYYYAEAEKHDWGAMIVLSVCYHYGITVRKNDRLSELWKKMARSTYNYYEPNGRPFEEEFAEIEAMVTEKESDESSTN